MYLKTQDIKEIAQFNRERIEPKVLKDNGNEKLMLLAILKNQCLETHMVQTDALIFVISGKIEVHIHDEKYEIQKNNIFSMQANTPHSVVGLEDSYFLVFRM